MCSEGTPLDRLVGVVGDLARCDLTSSEAGPLGDQLVALRTVIDRLEAEFLRRLEVFDRRGGGTADGATSTAGWLRWRCRLGGRDAVGSVRCARRLADALPGTAAALRAGAISRRHAEVLSAASADLPDPVVNCRADVAGGRGGIRSRPASAGGQALAPHG